MDLKSLSAQLAPYLLAMVAWMLVTGVLHGLITWLSGPDFATKWPRLNHFFVSSRINPIGMLQAVIDRVPPPPKPPTLLADATPILPKPPALPLLMFCLGIGALCVAAVSSVVGCKSLPPIPPAVLTSAIADGCTLVPILDPAGAGVAAVCEAVAPIVGPIVTDVLNALGAAKAADADPTHYLPITRGTVIVGYVRADIAAAVQARLDAVPMVDAGAPR